MGPLLRSESIHFECTLKGIFTIDPKLPSSLAPFLPPSVLVPTFPWWQGRVFFVSQKASPWGKIYHGLFYSIPLFQFCIGSTQKSNGGKPHVPHEQPNILGHASRQTKKMQGTKELGHVPAGVFKRGVSHNFVLEFARLIVTSLNAYNIIRVWTFPWQWFSPKSNQKFLLAKLHWRRPN